MTDWIGVQCMLCNGHSFSKDLEYPLSIFDVLWLGLATRDTHLPNMMEGCELFETFLTLLRLAIS